MTDSEMRRLEEIRQKYFGEYQHLDVVVASKSMEEVEAVLRAKYIPVDRRI